MLPYITSPRCKAMPKLIAGCPAPLRLALIRVVAARAWVAAGKARPHAVSAPASSGKIASIASPTNFRISPPASSTACVIAPKYSFSKVISASRGSISDSLVKPRKSHS